MFKLDASREAQSAHVQIELMDLNRFIELWREFYAKLSDADKRHNPLHPFILQLRKHKILTIRKAR